MTVVLTAGAPLEPTRQAVGRSSTLLVDAARADRVLGVDCWYPALEQELPPSTYELLPGVGFTASALADATPAPGPHPLIVFSHGRSGTRSSYGMLCEGLAARGYIVIAPDHPGDTLADWVLGAAVDDTTNETQRVDDLRYVLDAVLTNRAQLPATTQIDHQRVALAGHSYGAFTAFAFAGAEPIDTRIRAVAGLESFTRTLSRKVIARITAPTLLVGGGYDETTPIDTDTERAYGALGSSNARRVDIERAGHQACSDVGLYLELAPKVEGIPEIISEFLQSMAHQVTGTAGDPWRPTVGLHLRILGAWLDEVLERDAAGARRELDAIARTPGVQMQPA